MTRAFPMARERHLQAVEEGLAQACAGTGLLRRMGDEHLGAGGKRVRALIPPWLAENMGGSVTDGVVLGVGLELLHNATLVHDDLQDGDTLRRGAPTVWRRWGPAQAINLGDAMYFQGMAALLSVPVGVSLGVRVARAMERVVEGQVREFQLQAAPGSEVALPPTMSNWMAMAAGKTGALMGACVGAGAAAGGANGDDVDEASAWGETLGVLFQVQDDVLDILGEKGRGQVGSDIAEGKLSWPAVWCLERGVGPAQRRLLEILRRPRSETDDDAIAEGVQILRDTGALDASLAWLREARETSLSSPWAAVAPGLAEAFLAPISHVL